MKPRNSVDSFSELLIKNIIVIGFILITIVSKAQFVSIPKPQYQQIGFSPIVDSNTIITFNSQKVLIYTIIPFDTIFISPPKANRTCNISYLYNYSKKVFVVNEIDSLNFNYLFATIDGGLNWIQLVLPSGKKPSYYTCDLAMKKFYFSESSPTNNRIYSYEATTNTLDSFYFNFKERNIKTLNNSKGYLLIYDTIAPYNLRGIAKTLDDSKSFSLIGGINYSIAPFSKNGSNNGSLNNIFFVSDNFWIAEYGYDSSTYRIKQIMASPDGGISWHTIIYSGITMLSIASQQTAYIYQEKSGGKGNLFQISESGANICLTAFQRRISSMQFFNSAQGIILSLDTPNNQSGVWKVINGGGTPCSLMGIKNKIIEAERISISPNPASNQLIITCNSYQQTHEYKIYSLLGSLVLEGTIKEKENKIDINSLQSGFYLISIGSTSTKFIKD